MRTFGGIIIILVGISMIFPIGIPIFRIAIAIMLLSIGIKMLTGGGGIGCNIIDINKEVGENTTLFSKKKMNYSSQHSEYNVIFGSGEIDLRKINLDGHKKIEINIVFGDGVVIIDKGLPVKFEVTSVFAGAHLPNGDVSAFGNRSYKTPEYDESDSRLKININVIFGSLKIQD